jgi:steroid delta-isomerase-like uncharacterized protein
MDIEAKKALVRRYYDEVWSQGKLGFVDEHMAEAYENHDPATPGTVLRGRAAFRALVTAYREALPDLRMKVIEQQAEGDVVVSRWLASATQRGALMGIPPTNARLEAVEGVTATYFERGRIVKDRAVWDALGMLRALGVEMVPASATARNLEVAKGIYEAYGRRDMQYILDALDEDVTWGIDSVAAGEVAPYGVRRGKDGVAQFFAAWAETADFTRFEASDFVAIGDRVFANLSYELTVKATGKRVESSSPQHFTFRNGKIVRWRGHEDTAATRDAFRR